VGSAPQVNGLCGLPAGAATCSGEAPHALLFDTARGATPDELATLFQHAAAFRYDARQYAADARLGEGDERARVRLHNQGAVSPRTRDRFCAHMAVSYLPEARLSRGKVTRRACNKELKV